MHLERVLSSGLKEAHGITLFLITALARALGRVPGVFPPQPELN